MAVLLDVAQQGDSAGATVGTLSINLTVAANANRALLVKMTFVADPGAFTINRWDDGGTNQNMTQVGSTVTSGSGQVTMIFGLVAPTSGAHTFKASWSNNRECAFVVESWYNVDQTGGATTFPHAATATGTSALATIAITSAVGNAVSAACVDGSGGGISSVNNTQDLFYNGAGAIESGGNYANGAASVTMTGTWTASVNWAIAGTDIAAVAAGGGDGSLPFITTLGAQRVGGGR